MNSDFILKVKQRVFPGWLDMADKMKRGAQYDFTGCVLSNWGGGHAITDMGKMGESWFGRKSKGEL